MKTMKRMMLFAVIAAGMISARADGFPLITMRHMTSTTFCDKDVRAIIDIHSKYRGAVDAFWFAEGYPFEKAAATERAKRIGAYAPLMAAAGLEQGFQQGCTLGHDFSVKELTGDALKLPADAYQVDIDGNPTGFLCPTSPDVLAYEEWYAETYVREGKLKSFWLDDDLRLGFCKGKAWGCWCPRCVKLLNEECGTAFTREEFLKRLSSAEDRDPIRAKWTVFKEKCLAKYAAAARCGAKKANPGCLMAYQAISSATLMTGADYSRILAALSDDFKDEVGIRPGHGYYTENGNPWELVEKLLDVSREAERCRAIPGWKGTVCYEQENYPHHVAQKNPESCVKEAALAVAAGCDTVSLYWYSSAYPEPLEYYEDVLKAAAEWRPYIARLSEITKKTHLGGIATKEPEGLVESKANDLASAGRNAMPRRNWKDAEVALMGIPVTTAAAGTKSFYDSAKVPGCRSCSDKEWNDFQNRLDALEGGKLPVRLGKFAHFVVYPRVDEKGDTVAVTFLNTQIGKVPGMTLKVRRPKGGKATLIGPGVKDLRLAADYSEWDELTVQLPEIGPWEMRTVLLEPAQQYKYVIGNDHTNLLYRCGEMAEFRVKVLKNDGTVPKYGKINAKLMDFEAETVLEETLDLEKGTEFTLRGTLKRPGFLELKLSAPGTWEWNWSVGFEPEKIRKGSPSPKDFDEFWATARAKLAKEVPLDPECRKIPEKCTKDWDFYRISFATFGRRVYGYMTVPTDRSKTKYPVQFQVSAAGMGSWTNNIDSDKNRITVFMAVYPWEPHWDWSKLGHMAKYEAYNAELKAKYGSDRYCTSGISSSREEYFFYPVILGIDRAVDWVWARDDVDRGHFTYTGTSQGGGFGFYLCGLNHHFTRAAVFVPAATDTMGYLAGRKSGWPYVVESNSSTPERKAATEKFAPYFDAANFASRVVCPFRVGVGFADVTCAPCAVYAAYNEIPVKDKGIVHGFGMTHGCYGWIYEKLGKWLAE